MPFNLKSIFMYPKPYLNLEGFFKNYAYCTDKLLEYPIVCKYIMTFHVATPCIMEQVLIY
ncbi:hypothetical protein N0V90_006432 [Kalmusia sp. IMI 367209]|nr:hypothetical protein N0V90_006432 [Kalmusia sp. IMI 367209]